jgi:hypothetical protein
MLKVATALMEYVNVFATLLLFVSIDLPGLVMFIHWNVKSAKLSHGILKENV